MSEYKTDYREEGLSRLLTTLQGDDKLDALIASYVDRCQELEDAAFPLLLQRDVDQAEGQRLDGIGSILGIQRGGRTDAEFRVRIKAETAILNSDGTGEDLIEVVGKFFNMPEPYDVELDEAFPKSVVLRPRNLGKLPGTFDSDYDLFLSIIRRAASAGSWVDLVFPSSDTDADTFHFSTVADTTQSSVSYGTENGALAGAAI